MWSQSKVRTLMNICMRSSRQGDCMFTEVWKHLTKQIIFFSLYSKKKVFLDYELRSFLSFVHGGQPNGWDIRLGAAWPKRISKQNSAEKPQFENFPEGLILNIFQVSLWQPLTQMLNSCEEYDWSLCGIFLLKDIFPNIFFFFMMTAGLCVTQTKEWQCKSRYANISIYMIAVNACISSKQVTVLLRRTPALEAAHIFRWCGRKGALSA